MNILCEENESCGYALTKWQPLRRTKFGAD
jgi:hypothetical protein